MLQFIQVTELIKCHAPKKPSPKKKKSPKNAYQGAVFETLKTRPQENEQKEFQMLQSRLLTDRQITILHSTLEYALTIQATKAG